MTFESYELNNAAEENHARTEENRERAFAHGDAYAAQEAERDEEFERERLIYIAAYEAEVNNAVYAALMGWTLATTIGGKAAA